MQQVLEAKRGQLVDLSFVATWFRRYWLAIWFGVVTAAAIGVRLSSNVIWFFDAQLYVAAARAWLLGADPWAVSLGGDYFAAPPPTLLVLAPFTIPGGELVLIATVIAGAIATVRVLRLPWWWLLFPPLVEATVSGNLQTWLIPLILWRGRAVAVLAKTYAVVPLALLGRWRPLAVAAAMLVITAPLIPWVTFLEDLPLILGYYGDQAAYDLPLWLIVAVAPVALWALWRVGRERAAWMAVPALVAQQWYYATFVMATGSTLAAAVAALPVAGSGLLALIALGLRPDYGRYTPS
jgi:hypothetical protein